MTATTSLDALEARLAHDLACLEYPPNNWVRPTDGVVDVVVIGAGMCGLAAAFALLREGICNIRILDRAPAGLEGPWKTFARMETLRSPKHLAGPALGVPSLTFRAWYEAQWGADAWEALGRIPRPMWMDYLVWYRQALALPVENDRTVTLVEPAPWGLMVHVADKDGADEQIRARRVVLASGRDGLAEPRIPTALDGIPTDRYQHSSEAIDFAALAGRTVAVVGIGASALDNAAEVLEAGAKAVHVLVRAPELPLINKAKSINNGGFNHGFGALDDRRRWAIFDYILGVRVPPPFDTALRVARHENFTLHLGAPLDQVALSDTGLVLQTPTTRLNVDHLILGTGFRISVEGAAELAPFHGSVERWRDRDMGRTIGAQEEFGDLPYLGEAYEFLPASDQASPSVSSIHCLGHAGFLSHGYLASDIPGVSEAARRLAASIAAKFFTEDADWQIDRIQAFDLLEIDGHEFDANLAELEAVPQ